MLRWRLFSAAILISVLLCLIWCDFQNVAGAGPGAWLLPICLAITALGTAELLDLLGAQNLRPIPWPIYVGTIGTVLAAATPIFLHNYPANCPLGKMGLPLCALALAVCLAFYGEMLRYKEPGGVIVRIALSVFVIGYLGLLMSFVVELRLFHSNAWGMAALVSMIVVTKMCDTGAYFCGRMLGRHKMTPLLSPKKTIEGAIGGILASVFASGLFFVVLVPQFFVEDPAPTAWWRWALYGVVLAVAGMVGDLAESLIKRDMGRKDSSTWLPGLGGVLDVVDSLLFAAPPALLCWAAGLIGPTT